MRGTFCFIICLKIKQYIFKGAFTQAFTSDAILLDHTPLRPVEALRGRAAT